MKLPLIEFSIMALSPLLGVGPAGLSILGV
jgi:hypothetical protein